MSLFYRKVNPTITKNTL